MMRGILLNAMILGLARFGEAAIPAFPGALGYADSVTGGRGGKVYHVTNLDDAGTGSFRDAVSASNRIVVFDVGGYITLKSAVTLAGNLTIAGQTAPGGGIGIKSGKVSCGAHSNILIRHVRFRPGSETASDEDVALNLLNARNVFLDHCDFQFAPWNNIDGVSTDWEKTPVTNITFQHNLIASPTGQQFGAHCESVNSNWAWYYNAFVNSHNRNPLAKTNTVFVNNVEYNYQAAYTTHTSTKFKHDIVNNYFVVGPSMGTDNTWYQVDKNQTIYYKGNFKDANEDGTLNGAATTPYWYQGEGTVLSAPWSPLTSKGPVLSPASAFRLVTSRSGTLPVDQMDSLIWGHVNTLGKGSAGATAGKTGSMYTSQTQTGLGNNGYGVIASGTRAADTDNDGMPDYWESAMGLDVSKDDAMTLRADGYANIEAYINWLGDMHVRVVNGKTVDIDLQGFTSGFKSVSPSYTLGDATKGTATLQSDGRTVRFAPAAGATGLGSFAFTVKGGDGSSWTGTVSVLVERGASTVIDARDRRMAGYGLFVLPGMLAAGGRIGYQVPCEGALLVALDLSGRMLARKALEGSSGSVRIGDLSLKPGGYILAIEGEGAIHAATRIFTAD